MSFLELFNDYQNNSSIPKLASVLRAVCVELDKKAIPEPKVITSEVVDQKPKKVKDGVQKPK